jgi:hypothetical protein
MQIQEKNILECVEKSVSNKAHEILARRMTIYEAHNEINGKNKNRLGVISVG